MRKLLFILIIIQPFFWKYFILNIPNTISEYRKTPSYISSQIKNIFSENNIAPLKEMRWNSRNENQELTGHIFYNKSTQLIREFTNSLGRLAPQRILFGDNQICWFLLPAIVFGFIKVFKTKPMIVVLFVLSPIITVITGQPTTLFLIPTLLFYLYFAAKWFQKQPPKFIIPYFLILIIFLAFNVK
ncbi:MAG: hypothetical protein NTY75_00115 [Candidatus Shapirobacteria bacterium]|nr:hypothetical protein [Candidatus Shapirobacteria bacterium]